MRSSQRIRKGYEMRIKEQDYEQAAYKMVRNAIDTVKYLRANGLNDVVKVTVDYVINHHFPTKWEDENSTSGWTKHNEKKLRKYIDIEIKMVRAGFGVTSEASEDGYYNADIPIG